MHTNYLLIISFKNNIIYNITLAVNSIILYNAMCQIYMYNDFMT